MPLFIVLTFLCLVIKKYFNCDFLFYSLDVSDEIPHVSGDGRRTISETNAPLLHVRGRSTLKKTHQIDAGRFQWWRANPFVINHITTFKDKYTLVDVISSLKFRFYECTFVCLWHIVYCITICIYVVKNFVQR